MKRIISSVICMVIVLAVFFWGSSESVLAASKAKNACAVVLKNSENVDKIKYQSTNAADFEAIPYKYRKKVSDMYYVTSDNGVYNVCVVKAKTTKIAKKLVKEFQTYKNNQINGLYFESDYTEDEQTIMKDAVYGRKGKYVWYISMDSKSINAKNVKNLKKKL